LVRENATGEIIQVSNRHDLNWIPDPSIVNPFYAMTRSELEAEFANRAIVRGGLYLLRPLDAVDFVDRCREESTEILGLDGFRITENTTQPMMDQSVDFSSSNILSSKDGDTWKSAIAFLIERKDLDLFFEVVIA
jgi:hypothetical protein